MRWEIGEAEGAQKASAAPEIGQVGAIVAVEMVPEPVFRGSGSEGGRLPPECVGTEEVMAESDEDGDASRFG